MKTIQSSRLIMISCVIAIIAVALILWLCAPSQTHYLFMYNWAALAVILFYLLSPRGKQRLSTGTHCEKRFTPKQWWLRIITLQSSLLCLMLGISQLWQQQHYFQTLQQQYTHYGLFPWSWVSLVAIAFGLYTSRHNKDTYLHNLVAPRKKISNKLISTISAATKITTLTSLSMTLLLMCIIWSSLFIPSPYKFPQGANLATLLTTLILILLVYNPFFKKIMRKLFSVKQPVMLSISIVCIGITIVLIALNILFAPLTHNPIKIPSWVNRITATHNNNVWQLFSLCWWFGWSYIAGIYLARISKGYTLRALIAATLALPCLITLLLTISPRTLIVNPYICDGLATIGFIMLMQLLTTRSFLPSLVMNNLTAADHPRHRNHGFLFRKLIQVSIIMAYFILVLGHGATGLIQLGGIIAGLFYIPFIIKYCITK